MAMPKETLEEQLKYRQAIHECIENGMCITTKYNIHMQDRIQCICHEGKSYILSTTF